MNGMYDLRIGQGQVGGGSRAGRFRRKDPDDAGFAALLKSKSDELKFSAHAQSRVKSRNLSVTPQVMDKLNKAVSGAASKGAKDSLVLLNNMAFIVNIPNRTIVTAMDGESSGQCIYKHRQHGDRGIKNSHRPETGRMPMAADLFKRRAPPKTAFTQEVLMIQSLTTASAAYAANRLPWMLRVTISPM